MPDNPIKDFEQFARDAVYAAVGFGVLGFQKAQVRRREIADALAEHGVDVGAQVRAAGQTLRPLEGLRPQIDALRPQAEAIGVQLRAAAVALRPQFESLGAGVADLIHSVDEQTAPVRHEVDVRISEIEEHLPPGARAGVAELRAALRQERLHWFLGLLAPESRTSPAAGGEGTAGEPGTGDRAGEPGDDPAGESGGEPPAME